MTSCYGSRGIWLLTLYQYLTFTGTALGYPVFALYHEDSVVWGLYDWSFHPLQKFMVGVDIGVCQFKAQNLSLRSI